jgi:hypothetical protein
MHKASSLPARSLRRRGVGLGVVLASFALSLFGTSARAEWTWNVGYHNPAVSTWGLNLLYLGPQWGFETGIGWVDVSSTKSTDPKSGDASATDDGKAKAEKTRTTRLNLAGDVDVKYFLASGKLRPFLQAGLGVGIGAAAGADSGFGAGTGGGFAGLGLLIGGPSFYVYGSYNWTGRSSTFAQAGLGFGL